jgi:hypothetical protein
MILHELQGMETDTQLRTKAKLALRGTAADKQELKDRASTRAQGALA